MYLGTYKIGKLRLRGVITIPQDLILIIGGHLAGNLISTTITSSNIIIPRITTKEESSKGTSLGRVLLEEELKEEVADLLEDLTLLRKEIKAKE